MSNGRSVIFVDKDGGRHDALITRIVDPALALQSPAVDLVYVDETHVAPGYPAPGAPGYPAPGDVAPHNPDYPVWGNPSGMSAEEAARGGQYPAVWPLLREHNVKHESQVGVTPAVGCWKEK